MKNIVPLLFIFLTCIFPSCSLLSISQEEIDDLTSKFDNNQLATTEKTHVKKLYKNMIAGGKLISPEASKILGYYISNHDEDLYIRSDYFYQSDIIKKVVDKSNKKIIGPIYIKIKDDERIAYAINGFYINTAEKTIYQYIDFASRDDRKTYTYFDLPKGRLKIADRLIRVFEEDGGCKPFTVFILDKSIK